MVRKTMGELSKEIDHDFGVNPRMAVSTWCKRMGIPSLGKVYDRAVERRLSRRQNRKGVDTE